LAGNNSTDILTAALKTFYDVFVLKEYKYETNVIDMKTAKRKAVPAM